MSLGLNVPASSPAVGVAPLHKPAVSQAPGPVIVTAFPFTVFIVTILYKNIKSIILKVLFENLPNKLSILLIGFIAFLLINLYSHIQ